MTVTKPWRITWQAHYANKGDEFSLFVCQDVIVITVPVPECTALVYSSASSGTTASITKVYGDVSLDMDILGGLNSTWSFNIEESS